MSFFYDDFNADRDLAHAAMSSHREDGSTPGLIAANSPDVSDQEADEQDENIHLRSAQLAQRSGIDSELTSRLAETCTLNSDSASELMETLEGNRLHPVLPASALPTER